MKNIFFIALLLCATHIYSQSDEEWKLKVSDKVFEQFSKQKTVEYLIQINEQPDLSLAKTIKNHIERKQYVFNTLKTFSVNSQKQVIDILQKHKVSFKQFIITNGILVKSNYEIMQKISRLVDVKFISANPTIKNNYKIPVDNLIERNTNDIEWGIVKINANDVWDLGFKGAGVVIGGQDTGYKWTHEALKSKYRGWDGNVVDHNYNWHDAIHSLNSNNSGDNPCGLSITEPCDDFGHGTHTMGTMVGANGSNDIGVAPEAQWIGCRNMERGWGNPSSYLECFEWFLAPEDLNGENPNPVMAPDIINNSWHCPEDEGCDNSNFATMENAINNLKNAGIIVVSSAGNSGPNCSTINSPPSFFNGSFTVGASNSLDTIASFSSRGSTIGNGDNLIKPNIVAPGVMVRSSTYNNDSSYGIKSGTSMAAPHVAGAIALLINAFPSLKGNPTEIENILEETAIFLDTEQICDNISGIEIPNNTYGFGRLDILAAINYNTSMPLKLIKFNYEKIYEDALKLKWEIEEFEFKNIELQKSENGIGWVKIFETTIKDSYIDNDLFNGQNFYRLKLNTIEGGFHFSKVISFTNNIRIKFAHYPTIVKKSNNLNIIIDGEIGRDIQILILDCIGKKIVEKLFIIDSNKTDISIPINSNISGVHYIIISDKNSGCILISKKFIVQ